MTEYEQELRRDEQELRTMWETLCFEPPEDDRVLRDGVVCTLPRGHSGGHVCSFDVLDRYHELRLKVRSAKK